MSGAPTATLDDGAIDRFVAAANRFADATRPVLLDAFRGPVSIDRKADRSLVTATDRRAEEILRGEIAAAFPDHGIVGEEYAATQPGRSHVWVVDPIDGTHAFVAGLPTFGTLIALCRDGAPIVGVIDMPALGERWLGAAGRPTQFSGRDGTFSRVATRKCAALAEAVVYATTPAMFDAGQRAAFDALAARTAMVRYGTDCYGYAMVASGHGDLVVEAGMKVYDYLALVPVVRGAGGVIGDWRGAELSLAGDAGLPADTVIAAGDARLFDLASAALVDTAARGGTEYAPPERD